MLALILSAGASVSAQAEGGGDGGPGGPFNNFAYLPLVSSLEFIVGGNIYGSVTAGGVPAADIPLELRFYDGADWSLLFSTVTAGNGDYSFTGVPSLEAGQGYYVRYSNDSDPTRLYTWHTRILDSYTAGATVHAGSFDIANVELIDPTPEASVTAPYSFVWQPRPASPGDIYEFALFDPRDKNPTFNTGPLGHVDSYLLEELPQGFGQSGDFAWEARVHTPDGGFGVSFRANLVTFLHGLVVP